MPPLPKELGLDPGDPGEPGTGCSRRGWPGRCALRGSVQVGRVGGSLEEGEQP